MHLNYFSMFIQVKHKLAWIFVTRKSNTTNHPFWKYLKIGVYLKFLKNLVRPNVQTKRCSYKVKNWKEPWFVVSIYLYKIWMIWMTLRKNVGSKISRRFEILSNSVIINLLETSMNTIATTTLCVQYFGLIWREIRSIRYKT